MDGEKLLAEGDYAQASEKFWGAVAAFVKAVASERGWKHISHRDLGIIIRRLMVEREDQTYSSLFRSAERLHENFYENGFEPDTVRRYAGDSRLLADKLTGLIGGSIS